MSIQYKLAHMFSFNVAHVIYSMKPEEQRHFHL